MTQPEGQPGMQQLIDNLVKVGFRHRRGCKTNSSILDTRCQMCRITTAAEPILQRHAPVPSREAAAKAPGLMPSCHACGEIMTGVCPKCGASTQPVTAKADAAGEARECLEALAEAFKEPAGGEWWPIRRILERHGIFHDDIGNERALLQLVQIALRSLASSRKGEGNGR